MNEVKDSTAKALYLIAEAIRDYAGCDTEIKLAKIEYLGKDACDKLLYRVEFTNDDFFMLLL